MTQEAARPECPFCSSGLTRNETLLEGFWSIMTAQSVCDFFVYKLASFSLLCKSQKLVLSLGFVDLNFLTFKFVVILRHLKFGNL